ncbi:T6SS immunity protein Tli4 family protein [Achromobacter sp. NPDC058515]|uniref:T6SS immunity protein Tli4 family protein n=1 Tax=Achromobacter sp. NPDC058515 TaxID=3346533 RepID=UPI00366511AB
MTSLTRNMKTQCVGRILIDLPEGSKWKPKAKGGRVGDQYFSVTTGVSLDEFTAVLEERWAAILALKTSRGEVVTQPPHRFSSAPNSVIFSYNYRKHNLPDLNGQWANRIFHEAEGYIWLNGTMVTVPRNLNGRDETASLMKRMRARATDEIPADPGLCLDGAFIAGYYDPTEREEIMWSFSLPRNLGLVVQHTKVWGPLQSMLERRDDAAREIAGYVAKLLSEPGVVAGNKKYRAATRIGGVLEGEEFVMGGTQGINDHTFETNIGGLWEFPGRGFPSPLPNIELNMGTTFRTAEKPSSLGAFPKQEGNPDAPTEAEFFEIWDAVVSSVRVRPIAMAQPPQKELPPPKITREQAEADRKALDAFIAEGPGPDLSKPSTK